MEKKIRLYDKTFKTFIPNAEIEKAIDKVAEKINRDYEGCDDVPVFLCILNGAILYTAELMKRLTFPAELVSMKLSSYSGTASTGVVKTVMGMTGSIKGKRVLIIEDIVDTGNTIVDLKKICEDAGAGEVKISTLLFKPEVYKKDVKLDYVAMEIPNDFIVGFGLDYNEIGRNLPDIYVLDE
jgi:hypoxanthine phosphoribosyltransferase